MATIVVTRDPPEIEVNFTAIFFCRYFNFCMTNEGINMFLLIEPSVSQSKSQESCFTRSICQDKSCQETLETK